MTLIRAARFAGIVLLVALAYGYLAVAPGLAPGAPWGARSAWLAGGGAIWALGGWLTLLAIFGWMVLLVAYLYSYSPAHRIATMLQSGLVIIGAVLLIGGTLVWMNLLPAAAGADWVLLIDRLALTFLGAGLFMGGAVTVWIALDMALMKKLPWTWMLPGILAGAIALAAPFVLPNRLLPLLVVGLLIVWCGMIGLRRGVPPAFAEFRL